MTVASSATASTPPASFEIKSANLPLVALLLKSTDLGALARDLKTRFGDIPDFFENDPLVIDLTPLNAAARRTSAEVEPIDFPALLTLLRQYSVVPIAIKGGSAAQMADGLAAGLLPAPDARVVASSPPTPEPERQVAPAPQAAANVKAPSPVATPAPTQPVPEAPLGALVINKPLRSGQQIYARGRDLVVLAMVNAGAEIIADGHIHVYAPLRGKAMAGARGNTEARIFALSLEAELISIAGIYRTSENPLPANIQGKPAQVRLVAGPDGDKLVMDAM
ncbi:MAG: septum site-determining protein MinC [Polaromonas sp.]|jgi:septum site-determining protein MinC